MKWDKMAQTVTYKGVDICHGVDVKCAVAPM